MSIQIPAPTAANKERDGWRARQDIKLGTTSEDGEAVLRISTYKSGRNIETRYSFGWVGESRGFATFSCSIMTDYSGKLKHDATRATAKTVTAAHAAAMEPAAVQSHIIACVAHQGLEVTL